MKISWSIAIILSIMFVILSLPKVYIFTDSVIPKNYIRITFDNCPGVPTTQGIIIHAFIFFIFAFIILFFKYESKIEKNTKEINKHIIPLTNIKTSQKNNKQNELPIRRKLSSPEPIEMDPFDDYEE